MEIVTLEELRLQCYIDSDDTAQDGLIKSYARAASDLVFNYIGQNPADLYNRFGRIPEPVRQAVRLLVGDMYAYREAGRSSAAGDPLAGVKYLLYPYKLLR